MVMAHTDTQMSTSNANAFSVLSAGFPADLEAIAIETDTGLHYRWRDLDRASAMVANLLADWALPAQARVLMQVEKSVEALVLYLACLRGGYVLVPLNTAYPATEMAYFLNDAQPSVVVCTGANMGWLSKLAFNAGVRHVLTLNDDRTGTLLDRASHHADVQVPVQRQADDLAAILYTSGTTGRSKGAMLSHGNLMSNAQVLQTYWGWRADDVLIHALPIFHVHGLFVAIHAALLGGSTMRWLSRFDARSAIACMAHATVFMGVPTLYMRMLAEPTLSREATQFMRLFISGSAPLLNETFEAWQARTGHTILERYGMSETVMLTSNPEHADARYGGQFLRRGGTVGFPLPGVGLRVVDDRGRVVPAGQIGGIEVRGPNVFKGYWQMPDKTQEAFTSDAWFKTGDVGLQDERGYVRIVGRSKDLIISGGFNVYPAEVESEINTFVGVAESAVVGAPHPDFGEVGVALVVPQVGTEVSLDALKVHVKSRLANFKIPKHWEIASELPRNAMGKVEKNRLRERFKALFAS
jgi:malonyl-CoA/methylmalonyl-CoA synthetase